MIYRNNEFIQLVNSVEVVTINDADALKNEGKSSLTISSNIS